MTTYSDKLKSARWQRKRLAILSRDEFSCINCGDDKSQLQVHHTYYIPNVDPWEYEDESLITLCESCHEIFTKITKEIKINIGSVTDNNCLESLNEIIKLVSQFNPYYVDSVLLFSQFLRESDHASILAINSCMKTFIEYIKDKSKLDF